MSWKRWRPGDPVTISRIVWDGLESENIQDVLERDWFGPGHYANELEKALAKYVGVKYAQLTNSGSSALLMAAQALKNVGVWQDGDLILHPVCTFPTSCNPIWQSGMVPVFVDVEEGTYNIDANLVEQALAQYPEIKGAIIPHLIGNIAEFDRIKEAMGDRPVVEDSCDTMGGLYDGKPVGTLGDIAAMSFYGSHHITTAGVGGVALTNDAKYHRLIKSMTFWGRQFVNTGDPYFDFTQRYTYETIGYDMQMSEIQAAFGLANMSRLEEMNQGRNKQFALIHRLFEKWQDWFVLPRQHPKADPSWFGYPVLVRESAPFDRFHFAMHLIKNRIEIRPLFAGNLTRQKAYQNAPYVTVGDFTQADRNMERALFLPAWGGMTKEQTTYTFGVIKEFMEQW